MSEGESAAAAAPEMTEVLAQATERLVATAAGLAAEQITGPSLLPGWTRGHVLSHVARNADAMARVLVGAREGRQVPFYDSQEARDRDIAEGAGRPAREQAEDVQASAARFAEAMAAMPEQAWSVELSLRDRAFPASALPLWRLAEVEYHHADLDAGYTPGHWPAGFVAREVDALAARFAEADMPGVLVRDSDTAKEYAIGRPGERRYTVAGSSAALLAWLSGRASADGLTAHRDGERLADPRGEVPSPPPMA